MAAVKPSRALLRPLIGILFQPWMIDAVDGAAIGRMTDWQETEVIAETCPTAALSTIDRRITFPSRQPGPPRWEAGNWPPALRHALF